ncbi:nonsense-mediated mRNA decay factor SMG5 [Spodoptera frugiperda]|uniref:Nonsense-mediated mRNA decay factor SMG5 n=1 Tax=Spodoptera frugiperda TaxID=7108 RepID=A0A9R0DBR0_SPOFR|nr:nonsense-mediated mRNA decay factor SMG5 [Spodoptera frugiperda]
MKEESNEILEAKVAERNERAKKLYRYVSDVSRRVGEMTTASRSMTDLFSTNLEVQRQKLRDNCEKLLFLDPINYGKKSLELLWRKVYYETVSTAKKLRETDNDNDSYLFTHIVCGIGHFHHFISRIEGEMKIHVKEIDYISFHLDEESVENNQIPTDDETQLSRSILHSCLIYLGDLSRYQVEIFHAFEPSIAARYYLQAAHVDMSSGMPYNQLGNLYNDKNYNLDSVCYYIHCLSCTSPFEGAIGNLTKIFEKNAQYYESPNNPESLTQAEHIQNIITNFLSLIEIWYMNKNDTNIPQRCSTIAHELKVAMDFIKPPLPDVDKNYTEYIQAVEEEGTNPSCLNANLVHKIVLICLFTITKVSETDEVKAFACKAFTLALLSQLLQKLLQQLESLGLKNPAYKYKSKSTLHVPSVNTIPDQIPNSNSVSEDLPDNTNHETHDNVDCSPKDDNIVENKELNTNGDSKSNAKKSLTKRRRRRRLASSDSSDMSDVDTESSDVEVYESCSDEDDLSDSTGHSDESASEDSIFDVSDNEETITKNNGDIEIENNKEVTKDATLNGDLETKQNSTDNEIQHNSYNNNILDVQGLQNFLLGDNFLSSIKLLQDWALNEKDLILSCGDSGESLFQCVVDLLNILTFYFKPKSNENKECHILEYARSLAKKLKLEYKTIPLPEDINLRGTNICKYDKDAAEWQMLERYKLSFYEENIVRILNFIDFGSHVAKIIPRIRFNRTLKIFYFKKVTPPKVTTKINHKRSKEWHNSKKSHIESNEGGGLLRRLGHLWLASQVRELERSGQSPIPALLALDTNALHKHLRRVKQLLRARNFVLLIPTVVLQELDNLKREQSTARDAIRWLELQLRSGSRFLRAQRPGQSKPLPLLKYPRKAPPHVHNFIQIMEFCNHFIADDKQIQGGNGDPDSSLQGKSTPLLILLVGNEPGSEEEQYKEFSVTGAAQAAGISIEYIGDFYTKWRQTVHKNGKKR